MHSYSKNYCPIHSYSKIILICIPIVKKNYPPKNIQTNNAKFESARDKFGKFIYQLQPKTKKTCLETWKDPYKIT